MEDLFTQPAADEGRHDGEEPSDEGTADEMGKCLMYCSDSGRSCGRHDAYSRCAVGASQRL